jgi:NADH-quinone oxidoreductase subunit N
MYYILSPLSLILPEVLLLLGALSNIILATQNRPEKWSHIVTQSSILLALFANLLRPTSMVFLFSKMLLLDKITIVLVSLILGLAFVVLTLSPLSLKRHNIPESEFYALSLLSILGMCIMVAGQHYLVLYLGLELMSFPLYAMIAMNRKLKSAEAALKYFITGAIASGLFLYGISLFYGLTGSLTVQHIPTSIAIKNSLGESQPLLYAVAVTFILAGVLFKLGTVPFHFWIPDVYEGSPYPVTIVLATLPKIATFGLLIRVLQTFAIIQIDVQWLIASIALLSIALGNIVAISQQSLMRLLAYSSIAHMGYLLLAALTFHYFGFAASLFYTLAYALSAFIGFGMMIFFNDLYQKNIVNISDLKNLYHTYPFGAWALLITFFSMAGIPPFIGFMAKMNIFQALLLPKGYSTLFATHMPKYLILAIVAMLLSVVGAYYYLRIIRIMFFDCSTEKSATNKIWKEPSPEYGHSLARIVTLIGTCSLLLLGIMPGIIFYLCRVAFNYKI